MSVYNSAARHCFQKVVLLKQQGRKRLLLLLSWLRLRLRPRSMRCSHARLWGEIRVGGSAFRAGDTRGGVGRAGDTGGDRGPEPRTGSRTGRASKTRFGGAPHLGPLGRDSSCRGPPVPDPVPQDPTFPTPVYRTSDARKPPRNAASARALQIWR